MISSFETSAALQFADISIEADLEHNFEYFNNIGDYSVYLAVYILSNLMG